MNNLLIKSLQNVNLYSEHKLSDGIIPNFWKMNEPQFSEKLSNYWLKISNIFTYTNKQLICNQLMILNYPVSSADWKSPVYYQMLLRTFFRKNYKLSVTQVFKQLSLLVLSLSPLLDFWVVEINYFLSFSFFVYRYYLFLDLSTFLTFYEFLFVYRKNIKYFIFQNIDVLWDRPSSLIYVLGKVYKVRSMFSIGNYRHLI